MSEYWSDDDDDCISWKSLCLSEYKPRDLADDMESVISLHDLASDVLNPYVHASIPQILAEETELDSSSSWVFPAQPRQAILLPATSRHHDPSIPVDLVTRVEMRAPDEPIAAMQHVSPPPAPLLQTRQSPSRSLMDMFTTEASHNAPPDPVPAPRIEAVTVHSDDAKCRALEAKLRDMNSREAELESKYSALEMKLKALAARLQENTTNHSMEVRSLEGDHSRLKSLLQAKQAQVAALEESQSSLRSQLQEAQAAHRDQVHSKELQLRALQDEDADQKRIITMLEAKVDSLMAKIAEKDRRIHMDGDAVAAKANEVLALRGKVHDLSAAHDELKDTLRQNNAEMDRLRKELVKAQYELSHRSSVADTRPPPAPLHPMPLDYTATIRSVESRRVSPPQVPPEKAKSLADLGFGQVVRKPSDELNSSTNVRNLLSHHSPKYDGGVPSRVDTEVSAPFATDKQSFQNDVVARRELEAQLLHWHIQKEQLEAEYTKLEQMGCRTIQARRRKSDIESSLHSVDKHINQLKFRLR